MTVAPDEYLLLGQKSEISRLVMDSDMSDDGDDMEVDNPEVILPIQGLKSVKALAYDPGQQQIYWIEGRQKMIKRAPDHGSTVWLIFKKISYSSLCYVSAYLYAHVYLWLGIIM